MLSSHEMRNALSEKYHVNFWAKQEFNSTSPFYRSSETQLLKHPTRLFVRNIDRFIHNRIRQQSVVQSEMKHREKLSENFIY